MSENTTASTELTSQYAAQVTSDLEHNLKEQDRVSGEITALQQQLATLQHDHTVLVTMQKALGITLPPAEPTAPEQATVPAPRKKAASRTSTTAQAKKTTAAPSRERARKPAKKTEDAPSTAAQPSLIELIRQHLADQSEPRSTVEITAALDQAHPERGVKNTVVRTTVENLVAKGQAQRTKQGRSVYYTSPDASQPTPSAPAESQQEAQPEEAQ
ncbi:hypothetical protein AB0D59_46535 [Streptomyces sp. NPDC048417]|uniref:hypothetical protein n=1 Tax=Streptomyces sp. NPDC048417 TaxID=3155387 RepID=UPI003412D094